MTVVGIDKMTLDAVHRVANTLEFIFEDSTDPEDAHVLADIAVVQGWIDSVKSSD